MKRQIKGKVKKIIKLNLPTNEPYYICSKCSRAMSASEFIDDLMFFCPTCGTEIDSNKIKVD